VVLASAAAVLALTGTILAETYVVNPEGTGDFPTIQAAIDACVDGDIVELTDGTFTGDGNRDMDYLGKTITIQSQNGNPEICVIDCEGIETDPHRGFCFQSGEQAESVLMGVTIQGGWTIYPELGGAVRCVGDCSPSICSCIFTGNTGAAVGCGIGCSPSLDACLFAGNAGLFGAAIYGDRCAFTISHCDFIENAADAGGAVFAYAVTAEITGCTFLRNTAGSAAAVIFQDESEVYVGDCLFEGNVVIENTVVAFSTEGPGVASHYDYAELACCDLFGNAGGDWVGTIADQYGVNGNICEDPLFCDPENGDFTLQECSPCAPFSPPNPECDLIGAWPVGCGGTPTIRSTWGSVKTLFKD
jgi:hypothetical protein